MYGIPGMSPESLRPLRHGRKVLAIVLPSMLLLAAIVGVVPQAFAAGSAASAGGACSHTIKAASHGVGPEVECFLNTTGHLTFEPNVLSVPADASIVFYVGNIGGLAHTFTLGNTTNDSTLFGWMAAPTTVQQKDLDAHFSANRTALNLVINTSDTYVESSTPITLSTSHGVFGFVCLFPSHFQAGMFGKLYEGVLAAAPTVNPTITLPVQSGILVVAFLVLVVAGTILFIAERRGGNLGAQGMADKTQERRGDPH